MTLQAVPPQDGASASRADQVYACIKQAIIDFELLPEERFSESLWCARLGVSRTPVRQALHQLLKEGLVQVLPRSGWQVPALDFELFDAWYELRRVIEAHAVRKLCRQPRSAAAEAALDALAAFWCVPAPQRLTAMAELAPQDEAFHCALVAAAGNAEMARVHREVSERIRIVRRLDFGVAERVRLTYEEHAAILTGIRAGEAEAVVPALDAHIVASQEAVRRITVHQLQLARKQAAQAAMAGADRG